MERFRRRTAHSRVSVTTIVDQSSENRNTPYHPKGNQLVAKQNKVPELVSHSSIELLENNQLSFDLGRGSGIPMKKLLADEMSKETESGRRSPNIIARLMGLDGFPGSHNKKQKRLSDNNQRGSGSAGVSKNSKPVDSRHRKNARAPLLFKDVYEVKDGSYTETRSTISRAPSYQNLGEDEIGFIRQKFMDAKRLSSDERLHHSKELDDALEELNSNKDLLMRYLRDPDSLYSKHIHDLHNAPESYHGAMQRADSKNAVTCNIDVIECQAGEVSQKIDISHSYRGNANASSIPTKIVLLKPSLVKSRNPTKSAVSNTTCELESDFAFYHECLSLKQPASEGRGNRSKYNDCDNYGRKSQESRELAREITRRMKDKLGVGSFTFPSSGYKGYSADESSYDSLEKDSSDESEVTFVSSWSSSNRTMRRKSSSRYIESSVNMEAKKRLSERWKSTHRFQELGESSKGSTLAEMLAIPDVDIRPRSPDLTFDRDEGFRRCGRSDGTAELNTPLGISSRDGWNDLCVQNLSRSRSLPTSVNHLGSPRSSTNCEAIAAERFLIRKEKNSHARNKAIRREARRKNGSFSKIRKPRDEKTQSSHLKRVDDACERQSGGNIMKNATDGKESPEVQTTFLETPSCRPDACLPIDENVPPLSQDDSSLNDMPPLPQVGGSSCLPCTATHLEASVSSKESEQPSPVSVLEAPFVEDLSSGSECFERVSADLHGLRMQLHLLKRESEDYDEGSILISSDEYVEDSPESTPRNGACWEYWYLVDALGLSGLDKTNSETFHGTWHSLDCPIGPWVFEDLEKRYCESESCSRSERRLLFDHINAQILEISRQDIDMKTRLKQPGKGIDPQCLKDMLKNEVHNVLEKHGNKLTENELDMVILSEIQWTALREHISDVGKDIERLLMDELVTECLPT
ncbi:unnamed protein product [Amaranthus hypochondriacus]